MLKAVLFDWDGTLMNSRQAILASYRDATSELLGEAFPVTPEDIALVTPMRAQQSFGMLSENPEMVERLIAAYHAAYLENSQETRAYEGTADVLDALLDRGLRIGVVTSKGRDRVESDAERSGIQDYFEVYVTGDETAEAKPHPGPVIEGLKAMEVTASEALYVGDGPQDVIAGRSAGAITVAASYGFHTMDEIEPESPDHIIDDISQMGEVIDDVLSDRESA